MGLIESQQQLQLEQQQLDNKMDQLLQQKQEFSNTELKQARTEYNMSRVHIPLDELQLENTPIAHGAQGEVYRGEWEGSAVAVKFQIVGHRGLKKEEIQSFMKEIELACSLQHPNVIRFFGANAEPPQLYTVMEFATGGTLKDKLNDTAAPLDRPTKHRILLEVASGMHFLHRKNTMHRDLKSLNILLDANLVAKVSDFGLAKMSNNAGEMNTMISSETAVGTPQFIAPEYIQDPSTYAVKCDVYSFGVLCYEVFSGSEPWKGVSSFNLQLNVVQGKRPALPEGLLEKEKLLMEQCWAQDPDARPSFEQIKDTLKSW